MIGLAVANTPPKHGVRRGKPERQAVYLGKRFRLMPPQDHSGEEPSPTSRRDATVLLAGFAVPVTYESPWYVAT